MPIVGGPARPGSAWHWSRLPLVMPHYKWNALSCVSAKILVQQQQQQLEKPKNKVATTEHRTISGYMTLCPILILIPHFPLPFPVHSPIPMPMPIAIANPIAISILIPHRALTVIVINLASSAQSNSLGTLQTGLSFGFCSASHSSSTSPRTAPHRSTLLLASAWECKKLGS